nr:flagellar basal body rod C-terminal domain-containing protein [Polynucleobacter sp. 30F-ANTBAC]
MSIINAAYSALESAQSGLTVTSQNVAGASVEGYSRRRSTTIVNVMAPNSRAITGTAFSVEGFTRFTDALLNKQMLQQRSKSSYTATLLETVAGLDSLMMDPSNSISEAVSKFFNAAGTLASDAGNITNIQNFAATATQVASRVSSFSEVISQLETSTQAKLTAVLEEANAIAPELARINLEVLAGTSMGNTTPSADILDERDRITMRLQDLLGGSTLMHEDGTASFQVGGVFLVDRQTANKFVNTNTSTSIYEIKIQTGDGLKRNLSPLNTQFTQLPISYSLSTAVGDFIDAPSFFANRGSGYAVNDVVSMPIAGANPASFRVMEVDGTGAVTKLSPIDIGKYSYTKSGPYETSAITGVGSGLTLSPGFSSELSQLQTKTSFQLGQAGAAFEILSNFVPKLKQQLTSFAITLARDVNAVKTVSGASITSVFGFKSTTSGGSVVTALPSDFSDKWVEDPATHVFTKSSSSTARLLTATDIMRMSDPKSPSYNTTIASIVNGSAGHTYDPSLFTSNIPFDTTVSPVLDAKAANDIEALRDNFSQPLTIMTSQVGSAIANWKNLDKANTSIESQLNNRKESISGVNLDEEAANMIKFQQLYGAASKVMQTANQMFMTLLSAMNA